MIFENHTFYKGTVCSRKSCNLDNKKKLNYKTGIYSKELKAPLALSHVAELALRCK